MKLTELTEKKLKEIFIITDKECKKTLELIKDEKKIDNIAELMASKYVSLKDFLEDKNYERTFSIELNNLEKTNYAVCYIIATSIECIELIKQKLECKVA